MFGPWQTGLTEKEHSETFLCKCIYKYSLSCTLKVNAFNSIDCILVTRFIKMFFKEEVYHKDIYQCLE